MINGEKIKINHLNLHIGKEHILKDMFFSYVKI